MTLWIFGFWYKSKLNLFFQLCRPMNRGRLLNSPATQPSLAALWLSSGLIWSSARPGGIPSFNKAWSKYFIFYIYIVMKESDYAKHKYLHTWKVVIFKSFDFWKFYCFICQYLLYSHFYNRNLGVLVLKCKKIISSKKLIHISDYSNNL